MNFEKNKVVVTGMGVLTPVAKGISEFSNALKKGISNFSDIQFEHQSSNYNYPIAKIQDFLFRESLKEMELNAEVLSKATRLRNISHSAAYGIYTALEAWLDAGIENQIAHEKIAILSCGSNTQQNTIHETQKKYDVKLHFLNPNYGINFFDTDIIGALSSILGIRGEGYSVGSSSASGNMGIIQGCRLIASGEYSAVIVVAPMMDLSIYEYQAFTALGAMMTIDENTDFSKMYRPFDQDRKGFVYGSNAGCLVLESSEVAKKRGKLPYATIAGYGLSLDGNRNPNPSEEGEYRAMKSAIESASISAHDIAYVNTHGSGSSLGDQTEIAAMLNIGLEGVKANSTKSLIGHGLSAAGLVESIATVLQMKNKFIHKSNNLDNPIADTIDWVTGTHQSSDSKSIVLRYA